METGPVPAAVPADAGADAAGAAIPGTSYFGPILSCLVVVGVLLVARHERLRWGEPAGEGGGEGGREGGSESQAEASLPWVDPAGARATAVPTWVDPRWLEHLQALLQRYPPFPVGPEAEQRLLVPLRAELAALSFVAAVERCEASDEGGLELELRLREPVACLASRGEFALVDADGVVLEGRWPLPPRLGRSFLPVIGPLQDPLFERAQAGDWLVESEHRDALDVVLSMAEHLSEEQRAALGRIVVDARAGRRASVGEPGVRLELPGARLALFGRAPGTDEPGELAVGGKWRSLARALQLFQQDPVANDWDLVDLRWDRPELALRNAPVQVASVDAAPATRAASAPASRSARRSGPHVR